MGRHGKHRIFVVQKATEVVVQMVHYFMMLRGILKEQEFIESIITGQQ
jgi:hypothetical protein